MLIKIGQEPKSNSELVNDINIYKSKYLDTVIFLNIGTDTRSE